MRIFFVNDVAPSDTTSSAKVIHRHLKLLSAQHEVMVAHFDALDLPGFATVRLPCRPVIARALTSRRRRHVEALDAIAGIRVRDLDLRQAVSDFRADVVITLAQGGLCQNARRVARDLGKPLVVFFHDWSPDWRDHPKWSRPWITRAFLRLYRHCRLPLCVSEPLRNMLGPHPHAIILPPIPDPFPRQLPHAGRSARGVYAGVLNGLVEAETRALGQACLARENSRIILLGPRPHWGDQLDGRLMDRGIFRGFVSVTELDSILAAAACLIVIMPFAESARRFTLCSFPSKLAEYTRFGRPIIVWGPSYCSAAQWARETGAAILVTDPSAEAVLQEVERFASLDDPRSDQLQEAARAAYQREFAPQRVQQRFEEALASILPCPSSPV